MLKLVFILCYLVSCYSAEDTGTKKWSDLCRVTTLLRESVIETAEFLFLHLHLGLPGLPG